MHRIRFHWPAFAFAVLVGLGFVLPALIPWASRGVPFSSPANIRIDDEPFYFSRIREVLDGHPMIGNAYLAEHKAKPPAPVFLAEFVLAQPIRLFGASVVGFDVAYDFLLPAIAALLAYAILFRITRMRWLAFLATALLFWGIFPNDFGRAVSPQFNFLFWLSLVLLLDCVATMPSGERRNIVIGFAMANFGILFYLYAYYWTFFLLLFAMAGCILFLRGDRSMVRAFAAIAFGGAIIGIPALVMTARAFALPEYAETARRLGLIATHFPSGVAVVVPGALLFGAFVLFFLDGFLTADRRTFVLGAGIVAALVAMNQHVLTGWNIEFSSHYRMLALFWFVFAGAYLLKNILVRAGRWRPVFTTVVVAVLVAVIAPHIPLPARFGGRSGEAAARQRLTPALAWVNEYVAPDAVVYAPGSLAELIPIYTSANVYFAAPVRLFFVPDAELMDRFIVHYADADITPEFVRAHFREIFGVGAINEAAHAEQANRIRRLIGLPPFPVDPMPDALVARVVARARALREFGFEYSLKRFRADWVVWDRASDPGAPYAALPFLEHAGDRGDFSFYRVHEPSL